MTQTQTEKKTPPPSNTPTPVTKVADTSKPTDKPVGTPAGTVSPTTAAGATTVLTDDSGVSTAKTRAGRKVFVVVGEIHEFESSVKAEKFLNGEGAPGQYTVVKGNRVNTNKKVSLR